MYAGQELPYEEIDNKFPSPKPKKVFFTNYWRMSIRDIVDRDNLKPSHLQQLRVLCDLLVQYDDLEAYLEENGRNYKSEGRNGVQIKPHPDVQQLNRVVADIRNYSKMLGLVLVKDTTSTKDEEKNDFQN